MKIVPRILTITIFSIVEEREKLARKSTSGTRIADMTHPMILITSMMRNGERFIFQCALKRDLNVVSSLSRTLRVSNFRIIVI